MQKIVPYLWYDKEAVEAAGFYASVFPSSKVKFTSKMRGTPSGEVEITGFSIMGYDFQAISAGPYFKFNPSISVMVNFDPSQDKDALKRIDEVWEKLLPGGTVMMPLDKYPFSERYGWIQDKYGLSWQLIYTNPEGEKRPFIIPAMLFVTPGCDKAEEATDFYISIFKDSKRGTLSRYPAGMAPNKEGSVAFTDFKLEGQWFVAMDGSSEMHKFAFNEAVSLMVMCKDQAEIDYYWEKLSAFPEAEQCGWLKDKYGVSWQIVPAEMDEMMRKGTPEQADRVTKAFLPMKKMVISELKKAYLGK